MCLSIKIWLHHPHSNVKKFVFNEKQHHLHGSPIIVGIFFFFLGTGKTKTAI